MADHASAAFRGLFQMVDVFDDTPAAEEHLKLNNTRIQIR